MSSKMKRGLIALVAVGVLGGGGAAIAVATSNDDDATDTPITGSALERASEAALQHTGGGEVTETEAGDEEGAYEVEVKRADGSQVDVHLDEDFNVLSSEGDSDDGADED